MINPLATEMLVKNMTKPMGSHIMLSQFTPCINCQPEELEHKGGQS